MGGTVAWRFARHHFQFRYVSFFLPEMQEAARAAPSIQRTSFSGPTKAPMERKPWKYLPQVKCIQSASPRGASSNSEARDPKNFSISLQPGSEMHLRYGRMLAFLSPD